MITKANLHRKPMLADAPTKPLSLLERADLTINGQRQQDYGDKLTNFTQIAMLMTGTLVRKLAPTQVITAEDVALLMMQVKIARLAHMPMHKDSILDIAGYAGCMDKLQDERAGLTDDGIECLLGTVIRS
jgi:hypothetical protein